MQLKGNSIMKKAVSLMICMSMILPAVQIFGADYDNHWASSAITALTRDGIVSGYENGDFRPDDNITKAEMIVIINNFMGYTAKASQQFSDVPDGAWYADQLLIARQAGYFSGIGNNNAGATQPITRQDAFTMIARVLNLSSSGSMNFTDRGEISDYAVSAIAALVENGLVNGYSDGTIKPKNNITRGEIAWLVNSARNLDTSGSGTNVNEEEEEENTGSSSGSKTGDTITRGSGESGGSSGSGTTETAYAELSSLKITDSTQKTIFNASAFSKTKTSYNVNVQSDIYGVLLEIDAPSNATVTVTADTTTYTYPDKLDYTAGDEIKYDKDYGGYLIPLDQSYKGYNDKFVQTAKISVSQSNRTSRDYTVTITRECDEKVYNKFEAKTVASGTAFSYTDAVTGKKVSLEYNIYYPENYTKEGKYPVILALHGSGQIQDATGEQPLDMILKRYQMATIWVKDAQENPNRECIVIAPQINEANMPDDSQRGWANSDGLTISGRAAYALLESIMYDENDEINDYIDADRIYVTGLSMGGVGSLGMIHTYSEVFAAAIIVCGNTSINDFNWDDVKQNDLLDKLLFIHAEDDTVVPIEGFRSIETKLKDVYDFDCNSKIYPAGTFFYPSAHFSWTPGYADESIRSWLFEQSKTNPVTPATEVPDEDLTPSDDEEPEDDE